MRTKIERSGTCWKKERVAMPGFDEKMLTGLFAAGLDPDPAAGRAPSEPSPTRAAGGCRLRAAQL